MAQDRDELYKRRQAREEQRKKRKKAQRLMRIRLIAAVLVLLACGGGIYYMISNNGIPAVSVEATVPEAVETEPPETQAPTERTAAMDQAPVKIKLVAGGDLNVTDQVVWAGQEGGEFDYTKAFMDVAPILSEAELSFLNFEGNVCGAPYGTATASAPQQMLEALKNAGVDMLQVANSCSITNGMLGLTSTLNNIRAAGIETLGAYTSTEEFERTKG